MTQEDYIRLFRNLAQVTALALTDLAGKTFISDQDKDRYLSRVAEAVETLSSLRGDSSIFFGSRPEGLSALGFQKEMYATEDQLRNQLLAAGYHYPQR